MTSNFLTENEEYDIPSQILKTIFGLHASVIFRPQYVVSRTNYRVLWSHTLVVNWQKLIVYNIPPE